MRQILVDNARKRNAMKRGSGKTKISLDKSYVISPDDDNEILALIYPTKTGLEFR